MNRTYLVSVFLVLLLSGCGQQQPAGQQGKTFGGQLGDSYKGMLDEASMGVENANRLMENTERAVRERNQ